MLASLVHTIVFNFQESYERASKILKSHTRELKAISKALMKYDTLNVDEVKDIIENRDANLATDS